MLTLADSVVSDNVATGVGGGIKKEAQVDPSRIFTVRSSEIIRNTVTSPKGPAVGGGIYNLGEMSVTGSAVTNNEATGAHPHGGGIFFEAGGVPVKLVNSRVTGNRPDNCFPIGSVAGCKA